jgi:AmmeMemoRadiSam system protein A
MFSATASPKALTEAQGRTLVELARQTLLAHFGRQLPEDEADALTHRLEDPAFQQCCGVFVTLKKAGQLRGCIGRLQGQETLVEGVRSNALNAALHDPRFDALDSAELDAVSVEVSVLTVPQPLEYDNGDDLILNLRPGVDGVTIRKGRSGATFLPQVWDQLADPKTFLSQLCLKAGLPANEWQQGGLEVEIYQVQYFEELD